MNLPQTLDAEFKRLAREEQRPMEELVEEVARLVGKSPRQIYNFRSGKWDIPSQLIPVFCKRFRSLALLQALADECRETEIEVPEHYELTCLVSKTVRDDLRHRGRDGEAARFGRASHLERPQVRVHSSGRPCTTPSFSAPCQVTKKTNFPTSGLWRGRAL